MKIKKLCLNIYQNQVNGFCVKDSVDYFGIEIKVVQNYKDAINEFAKQTIPGKCDYYALWILSGPPYDIPLADGGNPEQFYPDAIDFVLDEKAKYDGFIQIPSKNLGNAIFAIDYSGSTNGLDLYHNEVRKIFNENDMDGDAIIILDSTYEIIDKQRMDHIIYNKIGRNGTDSSQIALALASNPSIQKDHLILVTDGSVDC